MSNVIILDRDGVINHDSKGYIKHPDEWFPIEGSLESISKLVKNGYKVVIATNQSGIGRGYYDLEAFWAITKKMHNALAVFGGEIEHVFYCPHHPDENCNCRKPNIGMLEQIEAYFNEKYNYTKLSNQTPFVGDSLKDVQAAVSFGIKPVLVLTGNGQQTALKEQLPLGTEIFNNLSAFVEDFLKQAK